MNERFIEYFRTTFFSDRPGELTAFLDGLRKPVRKTFRVNTNKISVADFRSTFETEHATLLETPNPRVFSVLGGENREIILGNTWLHLLGYMYIQELSASLAVEALSGGETDLRDLTILDMAGSPGGKTTQLSEYYPNACIIGNEPNRDRIEAYILNLERMGCENVALANYPGAFFGNFPETFDRVLLDAPCSGEGICYKSHEAQMYWNMKNVTKIAHIQTRLLDAAVQTLKVGGEMVYSTCTLNRIENEGVLDAIRKKYGSAIEVLSAKRYWPHEEMGGGFFISRIRKLASVPPKETTRDAVPNRKIRPSLMKEDKAFAEFASTSGLVLPAGELYAYDHAQLRFFRAHPRTADFRDLWYFVWFGKRIGTFSEGVFTPDGVLGRDYRTTLPQYAIETTAEMDDYFRGLPYSIPASADISSDYGVLTHHGHTIGLGAIDPIARIVKNTFPTGWRRKG